jgi:hypothetical protein
LKHPPRRNNISLNTNVLGHQVVLKDLLTRWRCIIFFFTLYISGVLMYMLQLCDEWEGI